MSAGAPARPRAGVLLYHARRLILFIAVISFVVTHCVLILLHSMQIDEQIIRRNAPLTLGNILFLSAVLWGCSVLHRNFTVDRHVHRIIQGLERIQKGDFSVRIAPIETDIEDDVTVRADAELLSLVWNNLFSNAIKFTERGGTVSCSLHAQGEQAVVAVSDTGCGMSAETGARIFEKFYQSDPSHAAQGNGLGLSLVKKVIDILGGEISVSSALGKGSTFTVRLGRGLS